MPWKAWTPTNLTVAVRDCSSLQPSHKQWQEWLLEPGLVSERAAHEARDIPLREADHACQSRLGLPDAIPPSVPTKAAPAGRVFGWA